MAHIMDVLLKSSSLATSQDNQLMLVLECETFQVQCQCIFVLNNPIFVCVVLGLCHNFTATTQIESIYLSFVDIWKVCTMRISNIRARKGSSQSSQHLWTDRPRLFGSQLSSHSCILKPTQILVFHIDHSSRYALEPSWRSTINTP